MADQISTKITDQIRDLIESSREEIRIGSVRTTRPPQVFQFRDQIIQNSPEEIKVSKNIIWEKISFIFDRGKYTDFQATGSKKTSIGANKKSFINSNNGNFDDNDLPEIVNAFYTCTVNSPTELVVPIKITAPDASIMIRHTTENDATSNIVYQSSAEAGYTQGSHNIVLAKGVNVIRIQYYRQAANGYIRVGGDIGSYISSFSSSVKFTKSKPTLSSSTSKFIDSKIAPTLANVLVVNRMDPEFDFIFAESDIVGFNIYRQNNVKLAFQTVSGFGANGFAVDENRISSFPLGGIVILPGPDSTEFTISGTAFDETINQTVINVSGTLTASVSPPSDIYIGHLEKITQTFQSSVNTLVSGIDPDVVAGTTYKYFITAFDDDGNESDFSDPILITAGDFVPPGQVTNLTALPANKSIKLFWDNPSDRDLKGIHIWDKDNPVSGTDMPIKTLLKGSANTVPSGTLITHDTDGALVDDTSYTFYASTFDWAGNEDANGMPSATNTTRIDIKTKQSGQRIETDTDTNQLRFFNNQNQEIVRIGENVLSTAEGVLVQNGGVLFAFHAITSVDEGIPPVTGRMRISGSFSGEGAVKYRGAHGIGETTNISNTSVSGDDIFIIGVHATAQRQTGLDPISPITAAAIFAETSFLDNTAPNIYSGYFKDAKVFIEQDLIVSGTFPAAINCQSTVSGTNVFGSPVNWGFVKPTSQTANGLIERHGIVSDEWPVTRNGKLTALRGRDATNDADAADNESIEISDQDRIGIFGTFLNPDWVFTVRLNGSDTVLSVAVGIDSTDLILLTLEMILDE